MRRLPTLLAISLTFTACRSSDSRLPPEYRRIQVPRARLDSPEARSRGRTLFEENCALCHGERGDGDGLRSAGLTRPPTDFTNPAWRQSTTPRRIFFAVREGLRGTPMPSWKWLGEDAAWDLAAFVLSLDGADSSTDEHAESFESDAGRERVRTPKSNEPME